MFQYLTKPCLFQELWFLMTQNPSKFASKFGHLNLDEIPDDVDIRGWEAQQKIKETIAKLEAENAKMLEAEVGEETPKAKKPKVVKE